MTFDKRFYGIYQGICVDSDDPENRGRILMQVPQVLGESVTAWAPQVTGVISQYKYPYGIFSATSSQTVDGANVETTVLYDTEEDTEGIYLEDSSKLVVTETGDYFVQFSAVFTKSGSSAKTVDLWVLKNGVDIPRSNTRIVVQGNPNESVMTVSMILDLDAGDYIQMSMASSEDTMTLTAYTGLTTPTRPDIPSIITTINLIGKFKPKPGSAVWASFLGGDPNFPLWIGTL